MHLSRSNTSLSSLLRAPSMVAPLFALGLLAACGGDGDTTPATGALTAGRVTSEGGASADVSVRAYNVASDGSMTAASEPATTDASGRYTLDVDIDASATALIVRVEDGTERMVVMSRGAVDVAASSTVQMRPIDARSTFIAEAELAIEAAADGGTEAALDPLFLNTALAAELDASADHAGALDAAVDATLDARATLLAGLSTDVEGTSAGDASLALAAIAELEAELSASLDRATDEASARAAYAAYLSGSIEAMVDAGYDHDTVATAAIATRAALEAHLDSHLMAGDASLRAFSTFAITTAIDAGAGAALGSAAIGEASTTLRADILAMGELGASDADVAAAWASYEAAVDAEIAAQLSLTATLLADLALAIQTAASGLQETWAEMGVSATAEARVAAYVEYLTSVESSANVELLVMGGLDEVQADAALDAMASIAAASE